MSKIFEELLLQNEPVIKTCGLRDSGSASLAVSSGANLLGIICVPNRKRTVTREVAIEISKVVQQHNKNSSNKVYLVGVFRNQAKEEVLRIVNDYNIDIVQLHGDEDWREYSIFTQKPIIKRVVFPRDNDLVVEINKNHLNSCLPLFDSEAGGTGELLDWSTISAWSAQHKNAKYILAGGLNPDNVSQATKLKGVVGVDVSGGIETEGIKDPIKIISFIKNASI